MSIEGPMYAPKDVAAELGFEYQTILKLIKNRELGAMRVHRNWRISKKALEDFKNARYTPPIGEERRVSN